MQSLSTIQTIVVWIIPVLLAITLHEAAHALIASWCGDTSAKALGRLSMNPFKHIDPVGTVLVPILVGILSAFHFVFGWAKPVPVDWRQLRNPRRDMAFVGAAGPVANLLMAFLWGMCVKFGVALKPSTSSIALFLALTGEAGIMINLVLAFLNLIPVPPLDGSRILASLLPLKWSYHYSRLEPYGFFIVVLLLLTGVLGWIIGPPIVWSIQFIHSCFGLSMMI